jgi:hypothetical protein
VEQAVVAPDDRKRERHAREPKHSVSDTER